MKLNENGLNDPTSLEAVLKQNTDKTNESEASTEETLSTSEYFYGMRLTKEQQDDKYVDDMKAIKGHNTNDIAHILGINTTYDEAIHRNNLVLLH